MWIIDDSLSVKELVEEANDTLDRIVASFKSDESYITIEQNLCEYMRALIEKLAKEAKAK